MQLYLDGVDDVGAAALAKALANHRFLIHVSIEIDLRLKPSGVGELGNSLKDCLTQSSFSRQFFVRLPTSFSMGAFPVW